ncbi:hypothetical protein CA54_36000 [Symmachiella macrocystis]|uniref:Uncharacterized protein n=1 Tax=Symmachiella macrocystis TaxID=2527985 RepID=A0A5C6BTD2_9PLAN|nr:hypothetical protein CA54_36000 [Symmachiella macrocystis]
MCATAEYPPFGRESVTVTDHTSIQRKFSLRLDDPRIWAMLFSAIIAMSHIAFASEPAPKSPTPHVVESGLLLLDNGKIIKGRISHGGGEYRVQKSRGEMFVPDNMVRHVCTDLHDAYNKKRADFDKPTASDHVVLARWCIGFNLLKEAQRELNDAVALEPGRIQSRRMLRRLDAMLGESPDALENGKTTSRQKFAGLDYEAESLGGLSRDNAQNFTARIQPILMNTCANAHCHAESSSDNDFSLLRIKVGQYSSRVGTQRNLAAVLKQVDFKNPQSSPLLTKLDDNHHGSRLLFRGRSGHLQQQEIRKWVASVAAGKGGRALAKQDLQQQIKKTLTGESLASPRAEVATRMEREKAKIRKQISDTTDAFDPAQFNQTTRR